MAKQNDNREDQLLNHARDELFSHIVRCNVLEAAKEDQDEWLDETLEYMAERYPDLEKLQLAQLRMLGKRYLAPAIPHGRGWNALTMERRMAEEAASEAPADADREVQPQPVTSPAAGSDEGGAEDEEDDGELSAA